MSRQIKEFISNVFFAFFVQGISLLLSVIMSLILPKIFGLKEYAYWQLFLFYITYVGFFHFGLNDGIYLRTGGKSYEEIDGRLINSQFWVAFFLQTVIGIGLIISAYNLFEDANRVFVVSMTMFYMVLTNAANFYGFIFQSVNMVKTYSVSVLIEKVIFLFVITIQIIYRFFDYKLLMVMYCLSRMISLLYCLVRGKKIFFSGMVSLRRTIGEIKINVSVGIKLLISTLSGMLVMGISRQIVDMRFGIEAFGIFSFSFSLTNFFLQFISQVSMVLFPTLKNVDRKKLKDIFISADVLLSCILQLTLFLYIPMEVAVKWWLPQYSESIKYFVFLLPICIYDGKMNILYTTYYKINREEKKLMNINLRTVLLSLIFSLIGAYIINNIYAIIVAMIICIGYRNIVSDIHFSGSYECNYKKRIGLENLVLALFSVSTWYAGVWWGLIITLATFVISILLQIEEIRSSINILKNTV